MTAACTVADLNHSWNGTHQEWDNGKMDGFTAANIDPADPNGSRTMGYFDESVLPFYYNLANQFSIADHYFASMLTQTFPNRFYLLAGTSFGHIEQRPAARGGYTQKTVFELLDKAKITWKIYLASFQVERAVHVRAKHKSHLAKMPQYYKDAAAGKLPQVAFVESSPFGGVNVESDEHPPANVQVGQKFTHDVIQALVKSPNWSSSAMFLTYDEHGGYYDHVAPPAAVKPDNIAPMLKAGDAPGAFDQLRDPRADDRRSRRTRRSTSCRTRSTTTRRSCASSRPGSGCRRSPSATRRPTRCSACSTSPRCRTRSPR